MFEQKWAGIVYGRTYNLDFRFITIPEDFSQQEINWASEYILATTRNARKLSSSPRWSLFKNNSHCVVGVTCMVRDLIGKLGLDFVEVLSKDNCGRPLYVFVGYVTQLNRQQSLLNLPNYAGDNLESFKSLYRYVERVWSVEEYDKDGRKALISKYKNLCFANRQTDNKSNRKLGLKLNHAGKFPDKIFLWQNKSEQNSLLWKTSANFTKPISICLNIEGKRHLDSPFLNQTLSDIEEFTIVNKTAPTFQDKSAKSHISNEFNLAPKPNFSQIISNKVKGDIELTIQQADRVVTTSQEIIKTLTKSSDSVSENTDITINDLSNINKKPNPNSDLEDAENFGFKVKQSSESDREAKDWF